MSEQKTKVRYDYGLLKKYCEENNVDLKKDYSDESITRDSIIEAKCLKCDDSCSKAFRQFIQTGCFCKVHTKENRNGKRKATCLERYGCENPSQNKEVKDKLKADSIIQYKIEERSTISRRLIISDDRMKQLISIMKEDTISSADKIKNLKNEIYKFTNENSFIKSKSMGELMEKTLEYLKRNYQNVSLIDLI